MIAAVAAAAAGFAILVLASDRFVAGAAGISLRLRVPAVVVGAVVVGFGTSAPEMLASGLAAAGGSRDIAVGNVVGSNLANLTLVLGLVGIVAAPAISSRILRREVPLTVGAMLALAVALGSYHRWAALALLVLFAAAMAVVLFAGHGDPDVLAEEVERELDAEAHRPWRRLAGETAVGLVGTVVGAQLLVTGARSLADHLDIGEGLVGFTLVALGTSLPEVVTSLHSVRHGDPDLAIGNVLGSNLFNSLAIGGAVGLISPGTVDDGLLLVAWGAVAVAAAVGGLMRSSRRLVPWEGVLLILVYGASVPLVA